MIGDVISLFSGVGCLDLALEWTGWNTVALAENDPWCQDILRKRWPEAVHYDDVRSVRHVPDDEKGDVLAALMAWLEQLK